MKSFYSYLALAVLVVLALPAEAEFLRAVGEKPLKGRYIVTLHDETLPEQVDDIALTLTRAHGGRLLATMKHAMRGFGIALPESAAIELSRHPLVKQVEEDELATTSTAVVPFDFLATKRARTPVTESHTACPWDAAGYYLCTYANDNFWHLDRLDNQGQLYATKRYGYTSTGAGVRAYVVDFGVYGAHSEFGSRVEAGTNMMVDPDIADPAGPGEEPPVALDSAPANNPCGTWLADENARPGHGTGVASVLAGNTVGVAKDATIVPVKVGNCAGQIPKLAVARGLDWIQADMQNRGGTRAVVNISFFFGVAGQEGAQVCEDGMGGFTNCRAAVENEINALISQNIVVVVSANNQSRDNCGAQTPARMGYGNETNFPNTYRTITVGGTMYTGSYVDERWTCAAQPGGCPASEIFANDNQGSNWGPCVSIFAPAWNINVAGAAGPNSFRTGLGARSGTSWSAPHVAGVAARLLERYPNLTAQQVWNEIVLRANLRWSPPDFDPTALVNTRLAYMPATE